MTQQARSAGGTKVRIIYAEATGSFIVLLALAEQQGVFERYGLDVESVAARGAVIPRLTSETPLGMIGEPAALLQAADGLDLRIVASFSNINLSGHLVASPKIKNADGLRGKRVGVRVIGAGVWISTILALEQLGLHPQRDNIRMLPIGSPTQILQALREGTIDAALVSPSDSRELGALGYSILLRDYPADITSFGGGLVVANSYLSAHADTVKNVVAALMEALAFSLAKRNQADVMRAFKSSLNITDAHAAESNLSELKRKPYPSVETLRKMQRVISMHDPRVGNLDIEDLIDDRFVGELDANGTIDRLYDSWK